MKIGKHYRQFVLPALLTLSACGGGSSQPNSDAITRGITGASAPVTTAPVALEQTSQPFVDAFAIPKIDETSWKTLTSPKTTGLRYSNDHTVIQDDNGNWHVIGITGGGNQSEFSFYHTVLSSLYPPKPAAKSDTYPNLDSTGADKPVADFTDKDGNKCNAWAPSSIKYKDATYLLFRSNRDQNGSCARRNAWRLEILKSSDKALQTWTLVNTYPTKDAPTTPVKLNVTVSGTPADYVAKTPKDDWTGWPYQFRDPGIFQQDDGTFLLYTVTANSSGHSVVPVYSSTNLLDWTYKGDALTLAGSAVEAEWGATESPFVFKKDDWYYLSITDTNSGSESYENTILFRSKDPLNFGIFNGTDLPRSDSKVVARLKVHAPEYIKDDKGQWYITTCGWQNQSSRAEAKQGVAIARLTLSSLADGLQASYSFEKDGLMSDSSNSGNTGTATGSLTSSPGIAGGSVALSNGSYMSVNPIPLAGDFTIDGWVKTTNGPGNKDGLFYTAEGHDLNFYDGYPRFHASTGDIVVSSLPVPQNTWTHVALTREGAVLSLYVDGIKTAQGLFNGTLTVNSVGRTVAGSLTGALDEAHVYNRALSTREIAFLRQTSTTLAGYPLTGDFTLASWVHITHDPSNSDELFAGKGNGTGESIVDLNFFDQTPRFYAGSDLLVADRKVVANSWSHVALTRKTNVLKLYVNGQPSGSQPTWSNTFELMQVGDGTAGTLTGELSGVNIKTRALDDQEIKTLYGSTDPIWVP